MTRYRDNLPQLSDDLFLTDGGIETTLIFHEGYELPEAAAFVLLNDAKGEETLRKCFRAYAEVAVDHGVGLVLESPTWRASEDWGLKIGYSSAALVEANCKAIELLKSIRHEFENERTKIVISGCVGPRGDGYNPTFKMTDREAEQYHMKQIETFSKTDADMVAALTLNYVEEAVGIARAARSVSMPVAISYTVESDGRLPTGQTLKSAIEEVDDATSITPAYYMINCAHPTHFVGALVPGEPWVERIRGIRANASAKSHAELDEAPELDEGNPVELGLQYAKLKCRFKHLNVLGGCCGTDHRHIHEIGKACASLFNTP